MAKSFYDVLGVSKDASADEIKSAYRKLARQYHPDLHPGDEEAANKFKEISEAYDTLSDPKKKAEYDNPSPIGGGFGGGGGFEGFGGFGGGGGSVFDSIFDMFGGGGRSSAAREETGNDIQLEVTLTFEEAAFGTQKEISFSRSEQCPDCKGTGAKDGTKFKPCSTCGGTGRVKYAQDTPFGRVVSERVCSACRGKGKIIEEKCPTCGGAGILRKPVKLKVNFPAGVETGQVLTVRGEGDRASNGSAGSLMIVINVQPHKLFKRVGADLYVELPVTFEQAILGDKVKVPTLKGTDLQFSLSEGIASGTVLTLKGHGITTKRGTGNMYVTVLVELPKKLTKDQKAKLKEFTATLKDSQYDKVTVFKNKAK